MKAQAISEQTKLFQYHYQYHCIRAQFWNSHSVRLNDIISQRLVNEAKLFQFQCSVLEFQPCEPQWQNLIKFHFAWNTLLFFIPDQTWINAALQPKEIWFFIYFKSTHLWHTDCTSVADRRLFRLVTSLWFWLRLSFFLLGGCHSSVFIAVAVCSAHFFASWSCGPCTSTRRRFVAFSSRIAIFYRLNRLFLLSTSYLGFVDVPLFVAFGWKRWQCSLFGCYFLWLCFSVRHFVARNDNCSLG